MPTRRAKWCHPLARRNSPSTSWPLSPERSPSMYAKSRTSSPSTTSRPDNSPPTSTPTATSNSSSSPTPPSGKASRQRTNDLRSRPAQLWKKLSQQLHCAWAAHARTLQTSSELLSFLLSLPALARPPVVRRLSRDSGSLSKSILETAQFLLKRAQMRRGNLKNIQSKRNYAHSLKGLEQRYQHNQLPTQRERVRAWKQSPRGIELIFQWRHRQCQLKQQQSNY